MGTYEASVAAGRLRKRRNTTHADDRSAHDMLGCGFEDARKPPLPSTYEADDAAKVVALIQRLKVSQRKLASLLDVNHAGLSCWRRGVDTQHPSTVAAGKAAMQGSGYQNPFSGKSEEWCSTIFQEASGRRRKAKVNRALVLVAASPGRAMLNT